MIANIGEKQEILKSSDTTQWLEKISNMDSNLDKAQMTFGEFLAESIQKVNKMQEEANFSMQQLASGKSKNIHETMLKVEEADIALRTLTQIKSKVIDAYREIMKIQI